MENTIKVSCSAVTHIGPDLVVNENRIYVNGKFMQSGLAENSQISLETDGSLFVFAISDGMDMDSDSRISVIDELKKFHRKATGSSKDIQIKLEDMAESVQQTNNLLYSISLGSEEENSRNSTFSGLLINDGSIAAVNLGNSRVYKVEADILKPVLSDGRRTDRLLKMGIINDEQAEILTGQNKNSIFDGDLKVKKSEIFRVKQGNEYLLCSASLIEALTEDTVFEIIAEKREPDAAASQLVREAVEKGCEESVTAMIIRIEGEDAGAAEEAPVRNTPVRRMRTVSSRYIKSARKNNIDVAGLVSMFVIVAIIAAVLFGLYTLWMNIRNPNKVKDVIGQETTQPVDDGVSTTDGIIPDETDDIQETESNTNVEPTDKDNNNSIKAGDEGTYTVKAGDSLMKISKKVYGKESKYKLIMEANGITDPDKIHIGQVLKIPPTE